MSKKSGSYYTPESLADFMVRYLRPIFSEGRGKLEILEPSCGDGVFIKSIIKNFSIIDMHLDAIDLDPNAVIKASSLVGALDARCKVVNCDYLDWSLNNSKKYDLIIGNPPYISKKHLDEEQKKKCLLIHKKFSLLGTEIHNIWTSFLADAMDRVCNDGVIAFVLPAELLKVKFAEKIQVALLKQFQRIEIFTFSNNVFNNIEQDTIILFLFKKHKKNGLYFTTINNSKSLVNSSFKLQRKRSLEEMQLKWSAYPLKEFQIKKIIQFKDKLPRIDTYCNTIPGIVTAANDYFIVSKSIVDKYDLQDIVWPIIRKGGSLRDSINLTKNVIDELDNSNKALYFIDMSKVDPLNRKHLDYIDLGVNDGINLRYKCTLREKWYVVPGVLTSQAFVFKRCSDYPRLIYNQTDTLVTDSAYRIFMKEKFDICSLIFSFYNSLTLAFCELQGRYYGGGVLELTPLEFKSLPIPYVNISKSNFNSFVELYDKKTSIVDVLEHNDQVLLIDYLGMNKEDINELRKIRNILAMRRLNINKSQFI